MNDKSGFIALACLTIFICEVILTSISIYIFDYVPETIYLDFIWGGLALITGTHWLIKKYYNA